MKVDEGVEGRWWVEVDGDGWRFKIRGFEIERESRGS